MTLDWLAWPDRGDVFGVVWCSLVDSAVGPTGVLVLDVVLEQSSELAFVPDDGSVQEFMAQSAHLSFGECAGLR